MKSTKKSLALSALSLMLCIAMLLGTTYAWFTDSVTSGKNRIIAGNLDVEMTFKNAKNASKTTPSDLDWTDVQTESENDPHFFTDANGEEIIWEPGVMSFAQFNVENVGNLALKYVFQTEVAFNKIVADGHNLSEVIKVAKLDGAQVPTRESIQAITDWKSFEVFAGQGSLEPNGTSDVFTVVLYWAPGDQDNNWNVNNGKTVSDGFTYPDTEEQALWLSIDVKLKATQVPYEEDSFDKFYDNIDLSLIPASWSGESEAAAYNNGGTYSVTVDSEIKASVEVPSGAKDEDGTPLEEDDQLKLVVTPGADAAIKVESGNSMTTYDVKLIRVSDEKEVQSDEPMKVKLYVGYVDLIRFYHRGTEYTNRKNSLNEVTAVGDFYYNFTDGMVTFMTNNFSPFTSVYKFAGGIGTEEHPYLISTYENYALMTTSDPCKHSSGATIYRLGYHGDDNLPTGQKTYFSITNDIDCDYENPLIGDYDTRVYEYNLVIEGNGHTISYAYGAPFNAFNEANTFRFGDTVIRNLTFDHFYGSYYGTAMGYCGAYNNSGKCEFENITVNFTDSTSNTSYYGGMLGWTSDAEIIFNNCHVNGARITGGSGMCIGGFVGNGQNVTIDNCSFNGSVISDSQAAGGFIGQAGGKSAIKNSEIKTDTIIKNKAANGPVYAFCGNGGKVEDCMFNGILICDNKAKAYQSDTWMKADPSLAPNAFSITEDGKIKYNGSETLSKVEVRTMYAIDRLNTGVTPNRFDGYMPGTVYTNEYDNVAQNAEFETVKTFSSIVNVVNAEYKDKVFNGTDDASKLVAEKRLSNSDFYADGTTLYVDGRGESPSFFNGSAKYTNGVLSAATGITPKASIVCYAYNSDGELIGTNSLSYNILK